MAAIGFLKRFQNFESETENRKYLPIADHLYYVASQHHNTLPNFIYLEGPLEFSAEDLQKTLSILYPEKKYNCRCIDGSISCLGDE